ncbi:MAG: GIY-YIG nuclease family protein [Bdellovibrionales bacterium]|nr:GIY-YIG nuclease family protein [Bdellovibrionales bacterium]
MHVYILQSMQDNNRYYVGKTSKDPWARLEEHNRGKSIHTNKYKPWKIITFVYFSSSIKAIQFERYLKSGSGRAFCKRHF